MTYYEEGVRDEVVPEPGIRFGDDLENGAYIKLGKGPEECGPVGELDGAEGESSSGRRGSWWYWVRLVLLGACLVVLTGVCIKWVGPFFMDKVSVCVQIN